jgi:hypothetical protein
MLSTEVVIRNFIDLINFGVLSKIALMIKLNHNIFERSQVSCSDSSVMNRKHQPGFKHDELVVSLP